ncbi:ubiquinol--cytochrome-c reductase subunit 6 [Coemansia sp. BCRC 34301]|nr:ubiquinol--cytochrome-c reductase subunit 6 [Coemansia sp. BCRC 34301]
MGFFDIINPFSYVTPVHADDGETDEAAAEIVSESADFVASDPIEEETTEGETTEGETTDDEEEEEAESTGEEEEEEECVDPADAIKAACKETLHCRSLNHHYEKCAARVEEGSKESCAEEFLHLMHCIDKCAVPQIFSKFK